MRKFLTALLVAAALCSGCASKYVYTTDEVSVTADDLYKELYKEQGIPAIASLLNSTVPDLKYETTDFLRNAAREDSVNLVSYYKETEGVSYKETLDELMKSYGYRDHNDIENYFLDMYKANKMVKDYIESTMDENKIREISYILVKFENDTPHDASPTPDEQKRMDAIDNELKNGTSFAETAQKYSEDESTASSGGLLGVIDKYTSTLVPSFTEAALELEEEETSDWVYSQEFGYFRIRNNASTLEKIKELYPEQYEQEMVIGGAWYDSLINSWDPSIYARALYTAAKDMDIGFADPTVERELLEYLQLEDLLPKDSAANACSVNKGDCK